MQTTTTTTTPTTTPITAVASTTPELVSETSGVIKKPRPTVSPIPQTPFEEVVTGGNFGVLPLPANVTIRTDGCSITYGCTIWYNYYDAGSREIVLQGQQSERKVVHEHLHAHQHWSINGGANLAPSDYDLESWYSTQEGQSFMAAVGVPNPWPWSDESFANGIESFAIVGSFWYTNPQQLHDLCLVCYNWARRNLP